MATYNVYLATPYRKLTLPIFYAPIRDTLEGWFQQAVLKTPSLGFTQARVQYTSGTPSLAARELLVYLLPSRAQSIWIYNAIAQWQRQGKSQQQIDTLANQERAKLANYGGGYSNVIGNEALSEVWLDECPKDARSVACAIFHELMHNASRMTMAHGLFGDLSNSPPWNTGGAKVGKDLIAMSNWIGNALSQFAAGVTLYKQNNP